MLFNVWKQTNEHSIAVFPRKNVIHFFSPTPLMSAKVPTNFETNNEGAAAKPFEARNEGWMQLMQLP